MIDNKTQLTSYLSQFKEEIPLWLESYTEGNNVSFSDIMSSRIGYYPGSGYDGMLMEIGSSSQSIHSFLYVDYCLSKQDLINHLSQPDAISGYHSIGRINWQEKDIAPNTAHITPLEMSPDCLNRWRKIIPSLEQPYCFTEILERNSDKDDNWGDKRFAITFLCADGIATYYQLFCNEYNKAPWLVLLQDHAFGFNYDKFGKGGLLDKIIEDSGLKPNYVLCGDNTKIWDGYDKIKSVPSVIGGMSNNSRSLHIKHS